MHVGHTHTGEGLIQLPRRHVKLLLHPRAGQPERHPPPCLLQQAVPAGHERRGFEGQQRQAVGCKQRRGMTGGLAHLARQQVSPSSCIWRGRQAPSARAGSLACLARVILKSAACANGSPGVRQPLCPHRLLRLLEAAEP